MENGNDPNNVKYDCPGQWSGRLCHARAHDPNTAGLFGLAKSNKGVQVLCLTIPSSTSRGSFKKIVQNGQWSLSTLSTDLPFRFCKIGLRNTLFIFGRKIVVCYFVCFVCFNTLSDFGLFF